MPFFSRIRDGFTIAELLIALLILGEIATFTIPKIISSQQNAQKMAVFKETLAAISTANKPRCADKDALCRCQQLHDLFLDDPQRRKNLLNQFPLTRLLDGCHGSNGEDTQPGLILLNGAYITGFDNNAYETAVVVDWNGLGSPNIMGDDQIKIDVNFGSTNPPMGGNGSKAIGTIAPFTGDASSAALYLTIFQ
jgi:prepilin-type N-terminal cleavage/methylation domain-containing protein